MPPYLVGNHQQHDSFTLNQKWQKSFPFELKEKYENILMALVYHLSSDKYVSRCKK